MPAIALNLTADEREAAAAAKRAEAVLHLREEAESFERCDTDGFLSQWASGVSATVREAEARLIEQDGLTETRALFDLNGNLASTHVFYKKNPYGYGEIESWRMNDEFVANGGKRFITLSNANKGETRYRNNEKKGVRVGTIRVRGYVKVRGSYNAARGVILPNVDDIMNGDFDIVSTDNRDLTDY